MRVYRDLKTIRTLCTNRYRLNRQSRHPIFFFFIRYGFYGIAFTPLLVSYTCRIWPYDLRARCLALGMNSTRVALFFLTHSSIRLSLVRLRGSTTLFIV
ncbi:hypothetical protein BDW75DRAFT_223792 [Aspergillus navahoensis]